ncbi:MAG TPA: CBS domain-containing protein [Burkholderiales bacterium]|nr:CBS domain-containing protein [Burkholderiales bacterium]
MIPSKVVLVDSAMSRSVVTVLPSARIREAAQLMRERRVGCLVVSMGGPPLGMLTESDVVRLVAAAADLDRLRVEDAMTRPVVTVRLGSDLDVAAELMRERRLKRLVVVQGEEIRGVLTVRDVAYGQPELARAYLASIMARPDE